MLSKFNNGKFPSLSLSQANYLIFHIYYTCTLFFFTENETSMVMVKVAMVSVVLNHHSKYYPSLHTTFARLSRGAQIPFRLKSSPFKAI